MRQDGTSARVANATMKPMRLELSHVGKRFGAQRVLQDLTLSFAPGTVVAVIGLNGAGKTTLLRVLAGILVPERGRLSIDGARYNRDDLGQRQRLQFLPDAPFFVTGQTVVEHLATVLRLYGREAAGTAAALEVLTGLDLLTLAEANPASLSRGQRYKAALAGLLLAQPELWLLDEPFASGMDPRGIHMLRTRARAAAAAGATVVYSTQILEIAEPFCDRIIVLDQGRVGFDFSRAELEVMPRSGPGSLAETLAQFREPGG